MVDLPLRGNRIVIRDWKSEDLGVLEAAMQPGQAWQQLDGPYYSRGTEEDRAKGLARVAERIEARDWPDPRVQLVIANASDDVMIGRVSWYWQSAETLWLSAGLVIFDPDLWGQGIGSEALGLWCQYLFDNMPEIHRLDLRTWSGNPGMMRLAEKLGFQQEARFRNARIVDGELYDGLGYGVLREEWERLYPEGFTCS